jgi:MtN3 and saliva related transmembrane protein
MNADIVGWAASVVLMATLIQQIVTQLRDRSARGVSRWLFLGQIASSIGFVVYSVLLGNTVFIVTNSCILLTAVAGQVLTARRSREQAPRR